MDVRAFTKLKTGVNEFLESNADNFIEHSNKKLDESLGYAKKDIKQLQASAEAASKDKEALQDSYDEKKKEHDDLIEKEKEKLEAIRERLLYGQGSRKKEMITWIEKDFEKFKTNQNTKTWTVMDDTGAVLGTILLNQNKFTATSAAARRSARSRPWSASTQEQGWHTA